MSGSASQSLEPTNPQRPAGPASDEVWQRAIRKGAEFVRDFPLTDQQAGQLYDPPRASWNGDLTHALEQWGWNASHDPFEFDESYGEGFVNAARELKIRHNSRVDNSVFKFEHGNYLDVLREKTYEVDGRSYPKTAAHAELVINAEDGALFVKNALSPLSAFRKNKQREPAAGELPARELPALISLSDLLWAGWYRGSKPKSSNNPDPTNVKYLFSMSITNAETLSIIERAVATKGKSAAAMWPGDEFDMSTDEGKALLGSPNGKRWGYFLTQHKKEIGIKIISKVTVFISREGSDPILLFRVT